MKELNTHTDTDKIIAYLQDGTGTIQLSPKLKERLDRLEVAADLIRLWGTRLKVIPMLIEQYKYDKATAYRDFDDAQLVFGCTHKASRPFWVDVIIGQIIETKRLAIKNDDARAAAAADKNLIACVEKFIGDSNALKWEDMQPADILIGFFPAITNVPQLPEPELHAVIEQLKKQKKQKGVNLLGFNDAEVVE